MGAKSHSEYAHKSKPGSALNKKNLKIKIKKSLKVEQNVLLPATKIQSMSHKLLIYICSGAHDAASRLIVQ